MRGAEWEPGEGGTETILLMAQMLGFSRFSRVLQVLQNFQNFQTSQEYRIPVPSPRNRANHGPSMPCHGPLPMTGGKQKAINYCVFSHPRCIRRRKNKSNITRASSDADKCRGLRHIADAPATPRDAQRCSRCGATDPTSDCRGPATARLGNVGLPAPKGCRLGPERGLSGSAGSAVRVRAGMPSLL